MFKNILFILFLLLSLNTFGAPRETGQEVLNFTGQASTPSSPSSGHTKIYVKGEKVKVLNSSGIEKSLDSAESQGNFFQNGGFEFGTSAGWVGPVTATTSQLRAGDFAGVITTTSATISVSATVTIPSGFSVGQDIKVGIDLKTDLADNVVYFCGLADTTETSCTPMTGNVYKRIETTVTIPASKIVGFKIKTLSAVTTSATYIDKGYIGEWNIGKITTRNETDWAPYIPTFNGFGTVSTHSLKWKRSGSDLLITGVFTSGTPTAVEARIGLPTGLVSASDYSTLEIVGTAATDNSNSGLVALIEPTTGYLEIGIDNSTNNALSKKNGSALVAAGQKISVNARVRIQGWLQTSDNVTTQANAPRSYDLTVTGTNWTTTRATAVYYRQGNSHRLKGNIDGTVTSGTRTSYSVSLAGVVFKNRSGNGSPITAAMEGSDTVINRAYATPNSNTLTVSHTSATNIGYGFTFDVELEKKPDFADDVSTQYSAAIPRNQVAIIQYRGNGSRTTLSTTPVAMPLTTVKGDSSIVSIANNQFTLQAGEYDIDWRILYWSNGSTAVMGNWLWDVSGQEIDRGTIAYAGVNAYQHPSGATRLSLSVAKTFELRASVSSATAYLGDTGASPNDLNGFIKITKLDRN